MINIPLRVRNLKEKYGTNSPFLLCEFLKILIIYQDLGNTKGFSIKYLRKKLICLNENLNEIDAKIVCAHELGHCMLHQLKDMNFMMSHTRLIRTSILEKEANIFAIELLYDDIHDEYIYKSDISFEVLEELKELKK